jgi:hypothetical protein
MNNGITYESDKRLVEMYKDKSTIAIEKESKIPQEEVFDYMNLVSINYRSLINIKIYKIPAKKSA